MISDSIIYFPYGGSVGVHLDSSPAMQISMTFKKCGASHPSCNLTVEVYREEDMEILAHAFAQAAELLRREAAEIREDRR